MFIRVCQFAIIIQLGILIAIPSNAQLTLIGKVLSADSKMPVAAANVFLSNTSKGTITNANGLFEIRNFPEGRYQLVISCVGYETYNRFIQSNTLPSLNEILLTPKVNILQEVIVEPYDKNGWENWGKIFMDNFIGNTPFASDCELLNKDALKFRFSRKNNLLKVSANERLVIINQALGYKISYDLTKFEYNTVDRSFQYQGYPFFVELPYKRASSKKDWMENRQEAYLGSVLHFMRSLFQNRLLEEKFQVRKLVFITQYEKNRVDSLSKQLPTIYPGLRSLTIIDKNKSTILKSDPSLADSLAYYKLVRDNEVGSYITLPFLLAADSISFRKDAKTVLYYNQERFRVIYLPKKDYPAFQRYLPRFKTNEWVSSMIFPMNGSPISILANGAYFEGDSFSFSGFWAWWEKIANKLPYDYTPEWP